MLSQMESKSPCDSVPPWLMRMVCSCVQIGNTTLPVSCVMCVCVIDCNSLNDHLRNPTFMKCSDKRLSIDLAALRQMVWLTPDGELREKIGSDQPDMVRWIDASCMVADCLTKRLRSDRLSGCLRSCWPDLIPTDESVLCKMKKQKGTTIPDGNAGDLDRNVPTRRSHLRNEISSIRHSDDESYGCENH